MDYIISTFYICFKTDFLFELWVLITIFWLVYIMYLSESLPTVSKHDQPIDVSSDVRLSVIVVIKEFFRHPLLLKCCFVF